MIVFILAATAASAIPAAKPRYGASPPLVQATATVRILSGARITSTDLPKEAVVRDTQITGPDGVKHDARLVEFP